MSLVELRTYDNSWYHPGGSFLKRAAWLLVAQPIFRSAWVSSGMRCSLLRAFGGRVGVGVVIKPAVEVKYPWHLEIGDHTWIGEHVWIDNLTAVRVGTNCCISQGAYLCTGNHDWKDPGFGLMVAPIQLCEGAWAGARCVLTPGSVLGLYAVASAGAVVVGAVSDFEIVAGNPARFVKRREIRSAHAAAPVEVR